MALSVGLHAVTISVFVVWGYREVDVEAPVIIPDRVISARLVAKGKPQPKKMLPRIQGRKAAKKEAVHLGKAAAKPKKAKAKKEPKVEETEEDRSATDILKELAKARVDERADSTPERYGRADGHEDGFDSQGTRTRRIYKDKVLSKLYGATMYTGIEQEELLRLKGTMYLEIDSSGKVRKHSFKSRSGNPRFDAAVERAVRVFSTKGPRALDPFPEDGRLGDVYRIEVTWNPKKQR